MLENSEGVELANQFQGFRIPDRWDASEKCKEYYLLYLGVPMCVILFTFLPTTCITFSINQLHI